MKKKIVILLLIVISLAGLTACSKKEKSDTLKFKEEYEKINNEKTSYGTINREVSISKDNPFIYKSAEEINEMIENKETFAVYFGFAACPWCRSVIETLIETAKEKGLDTIYYVDVYDIRDQLKLDDNGSVVVDRKGSDAYYKLLENLDNVLTDYTLTDSDNNSVATGEKRIFAPNVVSIINGKASLLATGISEKQTDPYAVLTPEIKKDTKDAFVKVINQVLHPNICTPDGC